MKNQSTINVKDISNVNCSCQQAVIKARVKMVQHVHQQLPTTNVLVLQVTLARTVMSPHPRQHHALGSVLAVMVSEA